MQPSPSSPGQTDADRDAARGQFPDASPDSPAARMPRLQAPAQLLRYEQDRCVALPIHVAIELLDGAPVVDVPGAAYYCRRLVRWRDQWLPLLDLETLMRAYLPAAEAAAEPRYVLVVAYQRTPGAALEHGAISLRALPQCVSVDDTMACGLPREGDLWPLLTTACFERERRPVPVLDAVRLFCTYWD